MDTFIFSVTNPSDAMYDILSGRALDMTNVLIGNLVEGGVLETQESLMKYEATIKNLGETSGVAGVKLWEGAVELEAKVCPLSGGAQDVVVFDNGGVGYALPDGTQRDFHYTVE